MDEGFRPGKRENSAVSDRVRFAVIGVGSCGVGLLLNLLEVENVEVAAVCDNYEPNYQRAFQIAGTNARAFYDHKKLLDDVKDLDGVVIATSLHEHAHFTADCLKAGLHVLCEKSIARTLDDAKCIYDSMIAN